MAAKRHVSAGNYRRTLKNRSLEWRIRDSTLGSVPLHLGVQTGHGPHLYQCTLPGSELIHHRVASLPCLFYCPKRIFFGLNAAVARNLCGGKENFEFGTATRCC